MVILIITKLYHIILKEGHKFYVSPKEVVKKGINFNTISVNFYSKGGRLKPQLMEKLRSKNVPTWVDFQNCIGVDLDPRSSQSFCFPVFTDKLMVFNKDISLLIYDQAFYEDNKDFAEEAQNFDTGKSWEELIENYWSSMRTLNDYLTEKPYPNTEVLLFEPVPSDIIRIIG